MTDDEQLPEEKPTKAPPPVIDRSAWTKPWAQLKYFTFQPAIFPRLLGQCSPDARPGDFVNVYDKNGHLTGGGLFNPRAKIPLRVVCHSTEPVNESYFELAIRRAVALRRELFKLDETTDAYRLINSDGDGLSGLMIDRYGETLLCEVYSLGIAQRLPKWLPLLHELAGTKFARVHVDHDLGSLEGIKPSLFKETNAAAPDRVKIREHGIRYEVDFAEGHKTGFFCDQRDNRRAIARFTKDACVLDQCGPGRGRAGTGEAQCEPEPGPPEVCPCRRICVRAPDAAERGKVGRGGARSTEVHFHAGCGGQLGRSAEIRGPQPAVDFSGEAGRHFCDLFVLGAAVPRRF